MTEVFLDEAFDLEADEEWGRTVVFLIRAAVVGIA